MTEKISKCDIAVVGAGPLGLMAAIGLQQAGFDVQLIGPAAPQDGRTTAILNDGVALLEDIGIWHNLETKTAPLATMRLVDGSKRLIRAPETRFDASELGLSAFGYNIKNSDLLNFLQKKVEDTSSLNWIKQSVTNAEYDDQVNLELDNGKKVVCTLAIAADGRHSILRSKAGIATRQWRYPQTALVMNLSHTKPHHNISTEFHLETGPFTLVPLPGNQSSLVWVEKPDKAEEMMAWETSHFEKMIKQQSHALLGDIQLNTPPMAYPLSGLTAQSFGQNKTILIGESAHVFPPIGAQGMNLGIRDLKTLLKLVTFETLAPHQLNQTVAMYSKQRRMDIQLRTHAVDALNRSLLSDLLPVQLTRGIGLYALNVFPAARQFIMRHGLGNT